MKQIAKDVQDVAKTLTAVSQKVKKLQKQLEKLAKAPAPKKAKAPAKKKAAAPKKAKAAAKATAKAKSKVTAFDQVMNIISRTKKGVNVETLKTKTGFNTKKIANIVFKGKNKGVIKSVKKGVYVKA